MGLCPSYEELLGCLHFIAWNILGKISACLTQYKFDNCVFYLAHSVILWQLYALQGKTLWQTSVLSEGSDLWTDWVKR